MNPNDKVWLLNESDEIITGVVYNDYYYKNKVQCNDILLDGSSWDSKPFSMPTASLFDSELAIIRHLLFKVMAEVKELKSKIK